MHAIAMSCYQLKIDLDTLSPKEQGELDSLLKRIKNKTVVAEKKENTILFRSGPKKFEISIGRPFADKENIEGMISCIPDGIQEISITGNGAILTFK